MKFYRYKQVQRIALFGFDDELYDNDVSLFKKSEQSEDDIDHDTKLLRFDIHNYLHNVQLSQNAKLVIESLSVPDIIAGGLLRQRAAPITIRMHNLNTRSYDSEKKGKSSTLIYSTDTPDETFHNTYPKMLYNFSIAQNFLQNACIELEITYPDLNIEADDLRRFMITFVIYDMDEEELLLKDTPEVDYKNFGPHFNTHNGRIPK